MTQSDYSNDIASIQAISSVPTILEAVAALTGLRFVCIARVTDDSWTNCAVLDKLDFGLKVGDSLDIATTFCQQVLCTGSPVIIEHAREDALYRNHPTPRQYGFESYISIPVMQPDGRYFGTLCALDPLPAKLSNTATLASMTLFAQLITKHLAIENKLSESQSALLNERETSELREQFIAVLGHDLRTPLGSILLGAELLDNEFLSDKSRSVLERMRLSARRMAGLVNDVVDFTRGRMGGGIVLNVQPEHLHEPLAQVVDELRGAFPERVVATDFRLALPVPCDVQRIEQLMSNLLKNALLYGDPAQPVRVSGTAAGGVFQLSIINYGPPISPTTIGQLFKPFWRASSHAPSEGLGLGLFIVAEIARAHGGLLDVACADGETRFTFRLAL